MSILGLVKILIERFKQRAWRHALRVSSGYQRNLIPYSKQINSNTSTVSKPKLVVLMFLYSIYTCTSVILDNTIFILAVLNIISSVSAVRNTCKHTDNPTTSNLTSESYTVKPTLSFGKKYAISATLIISQNIH